MFSVHLPKTKKQNIPQLCTHLYLKVKFLCLTKKKKKKRGTFKSFRPSIEKKDNDRYI